MPAFPREELETMVEKWLATNRHCEAIGDWAPLAELYTDDATYGWNYGPKEDFMAVGIDEIRDVALGLEMGGLDGWQYPYMEVLIDDRKGQVLGLWKQVADAPRPDGGTYEVGGIGGSWFRYAGDFKWSWQRDFFDFGNAAALFVEMLRDDNLSPGMTKRLERVAAGTLACHYPRGTAPVGIWEVPE